MKVATIISRICDPFVMLTIVFFLTFYHSTILVPAFLLMICLPLLLFVFAYKTKVISNWDISDRRERPKILWALLAIEVMSSIILHTTATVPILIVFLGFALITHLWKISGHTMGAAFATGFVVSRFGWVWWPVLLVVPLVGWARVIRKDHTILQVIAGAFYSWILILLLYGRFL